MPDELLRLAAVLRRTGLSRSALYRLMQAGLFPRPISLSGTAAKAWRVIDIDEWIQEQAE